MQGEVVSSSFNLAYVRPVQTRDVGELFLAESEFDSSCPNPGAEFRCR